MIKEKKTKSKYMLVYNLDFSVPLEASLSENEANMTQQDFLDQVNDTIPTLSIAQVNCDENRFQCFLDALHPILVIARDLNEVLRPTTPLTVGGTIDLTKR